MSNLESTRPGQIVRAVGVFFILLAITLTVIDLAYADWIWPVNLATLASGAWVFHCGTRMVRQARDHHQFMERNRADIARLRRELGES